MSGSPAHPDSNDHKKTIGLQALTMDAHDADDIAPGDRVARRSVRPGSIDVVDEGMQTPPCPVQSGPPAGRADRLVFSCSEVW
ncbi:MAG: hypothetical protein ACLTCB_07860 [Merdibacter sp.]